MDVCTVNQHAAIIFRLIASLSHLWISPLEKGSRRYRFGEPFPVSVCALAVSR